MNITTPIQENIRVKQAILQDEALLQRLQQAADGCTQALRHGHKLLLCGNGGSAADAQHIAAELTGRFYTDRRPLPAEALHVNTSYLTAVANDYGYEEVYARMLHAQGRAGDVLLAFSTSGNSPNILRACTAAREIGMSIIALTGSSGGRLREQCDLLLNVPSDDTPRIQEAHILFGHILCEQIEKTLFPS